MTTQIPYGPANAEYPQFAAGHAQYPPAERHASHAGHGYAAHSGTGHPRPEPAAAHYANADSAGYPAQAPDAASYAPSAPTAAPAAPAAPAAQSYVPAQTHRPPPDQPSYSPATPAPGYSPATNHPSYSPAPTQPGYSAAPTQHGYSAAPTQPGYGPAPTPPGYETQPTGTYPPPAAYPTAPPWAPQETPAPPAGVVTPMGGPVVGGLLVPYPEEMQNAPRAQAPNVLPVAVFTFFFSIFGAISAARRADQARRGRNSTAPYWVTFVVTLVASTFFWLAGGAAVGVPAYLAIREGAIVKTLEGNVVGDGQLASANVSAEEADCQAAGDRRADGTRDYLCRLTLSGGRTGQVMVTADEDGVWKPLSSR